MKTVNLFSFLTREARNRRCEEKGCFNSTSDGRPYCTDHFHNNDYIKDLLKRMRERTKSDRLVAQKGSECVKLDSISANEILLCLQSGGGSASIDRIAKVTRLDRKIVFNYVHAFKKHQMIEFFYSNKNALCVRLTDSFLNTSELTESWVEDEDEED